MRTTEKRRADLRQTVTYYDLQDLKALSFFAYYVSRIPKGC